MRRALKPLLVLAGAGLLVWAGHTLDSGRWLTVEGMRDVVGTDSVRGPLVFMALCVGGLFLHLPEMLLIALGGILFGTARGFAYGWLAAVAGSALTFTLARYLFKDWFQRQMEARFPRLRALDERLARHGFRTVVLLRLLLCLAPPLNWALGATRVRFAHYLAGTALGVVPGISLTVLSADRLSNRAPGAALLSPGTLAPVAIALVLFLVVAALGRRLLARDATGR